MFAWSVDFMASPETRHDKALTTASIKR